MSEDEGDYNLYQYEDEDDAEFEQVNLDDLENVLELLSVLALFPTWTHFLLNHRIYADYPSNNHSVGPSDAES